MIKIENGILTHDSGGLWLREIASWDRFSTIYSPAPRLVITLFHGAPVNVEMNNDEYTNFVSEMEALAEETTRHYQMHLEEDGAGQS